MTPRSKGTHFFAALANCLTDPIFADFTILSADHSYRVNRQLIACHSSYFKKAYVDSWEDESIWDLADQEAATVARLITFFYTLDYDAADLTLVNHAEMYLLADKFDVPDLKTLAIKKFSYEARSHSDDTARILPAIKLVYEKTTTDHQEIRSAAMNAWLCGNRIPKGEATRALLVKNLSEVPELAAELAVIYLETLSSPHVDLSELRLRIVARNNVVGQSADLPRKRKRYDTTPEP